MRARVYPPRSAPAGPLRRRPLLLSTRLTHVIEDREALPLLCLRGAAPLPGATLPVDLARPASIGAVRRANAYNRDDPRHNRLVVTVQRDPLTDRPGLDDLHSVAVVGVLEEILHGLPGRMTVLLRCGPRVTIRNEQRVGAYSMVTHTPVIEVNDDTAMAFALANALQELIKRYDALLPVKAKTELRERRRQELERIRNPGRVADFAASHVDIDETTRIELLMMPDVEARLRRVISSISHAAQTLQVQRDIDKAVREHLSQHEHEAVLRHKMRAIKAELDDDDDGGSELEHLTQRLAAKDLDDEMLGLVKKELARLARMNPQSGEANVARTWLECVADLPWGKDARSPERVDIEDARARLESGHHGLTKVKRRIIEHLCVRKLAPNRRGPILCFAGPPGVGKTSLAKSIAQTLGREFSRISLGGVRDDAEIRGHRRTYVGAQPGRFISALRRVKVANPVILLDEIDKLSEPGVRGDPAAALLEALDPEQNDAFEDHYLGAPFDLSQVMFICTANDVSRIPGPLLDRLELIELGGYTVEEKIEIARNHLLPHELASHGLTHKGGTELVIGDELLETLATTYTRESGVRNLRRAIEGLLRHVAVTLAEEGKTGTSPARIEADAAMLVDALGPAPYTAEEMGDAPRIGVVTGLGWTPTGGRLLFIEANRTHGEGKLRMTGRLGDVMRESAQAAASYLRANPGVAGLESFSLDNHDLHIHLPAGAVPKDGPSAGVGLVTAVASLLSRRPVRNDLAMTGEITLRGQVMPVGGIREKVLAAHRAGIREIILPALNKKDELEIPEAARKDLQLRYVSRIEEVLGIALLDPEPRASAA